jgi:prephenate dehydrogenase
MKAWVIGCGLIGGSIALGLKKAGYQVYVSDCDDLKVAKAINIGVADFKGPPPDDTNVVFIATPVGSIVEVVKKAFKTLKGNTIVTDVGSVKAPIVNAIKESNFVGGHPMAGSEQHGLSGTDASLFEGATWVLTPTADTDPEAYSKLYSIIKEVFKAYPVALPAEVHDELVGVVSHLPHLLAATLLNMAARVSQEDPSLLKLAAGGFRDLTRVASGDPWIWPDIFIANQNTVNKLIENLKYELDQFKQDIINKDSDNILKKLQVASELRRELPSKIKVVKDLARINVFIQDRPGALADVLEIARTINVNVADLEILHVLESSQGLLSIYVSTTEAQALCDALTQAGYHVMSSGQ